MPRRGIFLGGGTYGEKRNRKWSTWLWVCGSPRGGASPCRDPDCRTMLLALHIAPVCSTTLIRCISDRNRYCTSSFAWFTRNDRHESANTGRTGLSLIAILSLDWNFWPILRIFRKVWKCLKWIISVYFAYNVWFYSVLPDGFHLNLLDRITKNC